MPSNNITLKQLRYFSVLGRELNYRKAAERLFISQPAISLAIKQLETEIGVQLFIRDTRSVALTEAGLEWLPKVEELIRRADAVVDEMVDWARGRRGAVKVGYLVGTGSDLLGRFVEDFEGHNPGITVDAIEFDFSDPTAGLASGQVDIAFIRPPVDLPDCSMVLIEEESWVACLPRKHRLAARQSLSIFELLNEPIIAAPESAGSWRDYWLASHKRDGNPAAIAGTAATYESEMTAVSRGTGISFTTSASRRYYQRPGIVFVPIHDMEPVYVALAWRKELRTAAGSRFISHIIAMSHDADKAPLSTDIR